MPHHRPPFSRNGSCLVATSQTEATKLKQRYTDKTKPPAAGANFSYFPDGNPNAPPYGFHHISNWLANDVSDPDLEHREDGFVVYFDVNLDAGATQQFLEVMQEGFFVDQWTDKIKLRLLVYNADVEIFVYVNLHEREGERVRGG